MPDIIYSDFAEDEHEARRRAAEWRHRDPFKQIRPSLLSAEHIEAYVRQTAMLHPFDISRKGALKGASCEILPSKQFIRWEGGNKIITEIGDSSELVLPANSITFAQIESTIRLPDYIAIRFNLRIKHVHRGLLLGTGPLVDPAFEGDLLIPLHNLTDSEYRIAAREGLIWVEFTKTSRTTDGDVELGAIPPPQDVFKPSDRDMLPVEFYFEKANKNRPIESSIPGEVKSAKRTASKALSTAKAAKRTNQVYASIGFLAVLGAAVGLLSFLQTANTRVDGMNSRLDATAKAASDASAALSSVKAELERAVADLRRERDAAAGREGAETRKLDDLFLRLSDLSARVMSLENRTRARASPGPAAGRRPR